LHKCNFLRLMGVAQIMSDRAGVVNMHLAVDMREENTMTMLYKIDQGYVKEEHYGLALARVVNLPPEVLEVAEKVSNAIAARAQAKKRSSQTAAVAKRRKLLLNLKEMLKQAESGPMQGKVLLNWMRKLQKEFIESMFLSTLIKAKLKILDTDTEIGMEQIEKDAAHSDVEEDEERSVTAREESVI